MPEKLWFVSSLYLLPLFIVCVPAFLIDACEAVILEGSGYVLAGITCILHKVYGREAMSFYASACACYRTHERERL